MKSVKTPARLAAVGGFAALSAAFLPGTSLAATQPGTAHPGAAHLEAGRGDVGAVFVQNDNTSDNAITVYDRNPDGTLSAAGTYPTGGTGGALSGSVVDHLGSQGSLTYDRDSGLLYAVNAGSNTVTVFSVAGDRLIRRQVISSGGTFPVSVTVHGNLVYVLNARDGGSVQGYLRAGAILVKIPDWHRDLGLNPSLTPEFTNTPGDVAFTPDGSKLIVTTKGNGSDIDVFTVAPSGGLSAKPVATSDPAGPFAVSFDAGGHLLVAESGQNNTVATFIIKRDGALTFDSREATGGAATCWITPDGSTFYTSNAGTGTLSAFGDGGNGTLRPLGTTATDAGTVDATASPDGQYLYAQTGGAGIVDEYRVSASGSLTEIGKVTVPDAVGGEGIAAS
jgi:6-phosphogluconolactonase (cycloisomerase 2 family)